MQAVDFAMQVDVEKLGNVPEVLRAMADAYEARIQAGTHKDLKTFPMDVTIGAIPETKLRGRMTIAMTDTPAIGVLDVPARLP